MTEASEVEKDHQLPQGELERLSQDLAKTRRASESGEALIDQIASPNTTNEDAPNSSDEIAVHYLVNDDTTFWETYNFNSDYLPEDNEFIAMINNLGYTVDELEYVLGETVPIEYSEKREKWRVESGIKTIHSDKRINNSTMKESDENGLLPDRESTLKYLISAVFVVIIVLLTSLVFRQFAPFVLILLAIAAYLWHTT